MNEYVGTPMSEWLVWAFAISAIWTGIFTFAFAQFTMRRMEKQLAKESLSGQIRGIFGGGRIIRYALVILLPAHLSKNLNQLIDVELVRSRANNADWWRALLFGVTSGMWLVLLLTASIVDL